MVLRVVFALTVPPLHRIAGASVAYSDHPTWFVGKGLEKSHRTENAAKQALGPIFTAAF